MKEDIPIQEEPKLQEKVGKSEDGIRKADKAKTEQLIAIENQKKRNKKKQSKNLCFI